VVLLHLPTFSLDSRALCWTPAHVLNWPTAVGASASLAVSIAQQLYLIKKKFVLDGLSGLCCLGCADALCACTCADCNLNVACLLLVLPALISGGSHLAEVGMQVSGV
jgi:hypothetical protein